MRKLILYIAASLDNYIAKPDGDIEWLHDPEYSIPNEDHGYQQFYEAIDTTLMGNNTFKAIQGFDIPFPYTDTTNYVFTRSSDTKDTDDVQFVSGDIVEFVRQLKYDEGKDIWLIGGGKINTLMLKNDLIDKIILTIIPITLGEGIPLFYGKGKETKFQLAKAQSYKSGLVQLELNRSS